MELNQYRLFSLMLTILFPLLSWSSQPIVSVQIMAQVGHGQEEVLETSVYAETDSNNNIKILYVETPEKRFEISLSEIKSGKPVMISYRGVRIVSIQGLSKTKTGEGWLRITPVEKRISQSAPERARGLDLYIFPSEVTSHWKAVTRQATSLRWLTQANLVLDKNPFAMSVSQILSSPPKIVDLLPIVPECKNGVHELRRGFYYFGIQRGLDYLGCNKNKLRPESIVEMMMALNSHPYHSNYNEDSFSFWVKQQTASALSSSVELSKKPGVRDYTQKLEEFRKTIFDFTKPENQKKLSLSRFFTELMDEGEVEALEFLLAKMSAQVPKLLSTYCLLPCHNSISFLCSPKN